jgi:hypothetical protein
MVFPGSRWGLPERRDDDQNIHDCPGAGLDIRRPEMIAFFFSLIGLKSVANALEEMRIARTSMTKANLLQ